MPVTFGKAQQTAIEKAAKIASLTPHFLVSEPVSALIGAKYLQNQEINELEDSTSFVFDCGFLFSDIFQIFFIDSSDQIFFKKIGSTTKIDLIKIKNQIPQNLYHKEDLQLGGSSFDNELLLFIVKKFAVDQGIDLLLDPFSEQRLKEAVEKAKNELSTLVKTNINLPYISADAKGPKVIIFC